MTLFLFLFFLSRFFTHLFFFFVRCWYSIFVRRCIEENERCAWCCTLYDANVRLCGLNACVYCSNVPSTNPYAVVSCLFVQRIIVDPYDCICALLWCMCTQTCVVYYSSSKNIPIEVSLSWDIAVECHVTPSLKYPSIIFTLTVIEWYTKIVFVLAFDCKRIASQFLRHFTVNVWEYFFFSNSSTTI